MLVETYEVTETMGDGTQECEAEALALIEEMGLEGQQSRVKRTDTGETKRNPYRLMSIDEVFVYGEICPKRTVLTKYADGPVPLRVLQVAAHAKSLFERLEVWHPESAAEKDPVLVGVNGYEWNPRERFILARWGEELLPFSELMTKAAKLYRDRVRGALADAKALIEADISRIESLPDTVLKTSTVPSYRGL